MMISTIIQEFHDRTHRIRILLAIRHKLGTMLTLENTYNSKGRECSLEVRVKISSDGDDENEGKW